MFAALEKNFRPFYENAPDMFVFVDPKTAMVIHCNQTLATNLGYAKKEIIGKSIFEFYHPDCVEDARLAFESFVRTGSVQNAELQVQRKDGSTIEVSLNVTAVRDEQRDIPYSIFAWRDITERKRDKNALVASEELFRQIGENIPEVLFVVDQKDYKVLYVNPAYTHVWGRTRESLYKHPASWLDSIVAEDRDRVNRALEQQCHTGEFNEVFRIALADQSVRWIHDRVFPIRNHEGEIYRLVGIAENITKRKQAEEKLHEYQERLRSMASETSLAEERERRRIAAGLHDDIIQELTLSRIKLGNLSNSPHLRSTPGPLHDEIREIVEIVEKVIKKTRSLVFELSPPILYELGFGPALEWLADRMRDHHGIVCRVRDDERPKPLDNDVMIVLFQAVRELLNNVAKHAKARRVEISLRRENDRIQIHVKDNGVGFDTSVIGVHVSQTGGFGLFSIRERLRLFAGQLAIESAPGCGTRITLEAPLGG